MTMSPVTASALRLKPRQNSVASDSGFLVGQGTRQRLLRDRFDRLEDEGSPLRHASILMRGSSML